MTLMYLMGHKLPNMIGVEVHVACDNYIQFIPYALILTLLYISDLKPKVAQHQFSL